MSPKTLRVRLREPVCDPNKTADQRSLEWVQDFSGPAYSLTVEGSWLNISGLHATRLVPLSSVLFMDVEATTPVAAPSPAPKAKKGDSK